MTHELKILPEYFKAVFRGWKLFEIRKNDRDYKVGDQLLLKEWNGKEYTVNACKAEITYITDYAQQDGYVVLGIRKRDEIVFLVYVKDLRSDNMDLNKICLSLSVAKKWKKKLEEELDGLALVQIKMMFLEQEELE